MSNSINFNAETSCFSCFTHQVQETMNNINEKLSIRVVSTALLALGTLGFAIGGLLHLSPRGKIETAIIFSIPASAFILGGVALATDYLHTRIDNKFYTSV